MLRLHADALEHRAEEPGIYALVDGEWIGCFGKNYDKYVKEASDGQYLYTYVDSINLTYEMESGKLIKRHYYIWVDNEIVQSEAGRISEDYLTRWETINYRTVTVDGVEYKRLDLILENVKSVYVDYMEEGDQQLELAKDADSLIAALKADCSEGNMAQNYMYHTGSFRREDEFAETGYNMMPEFGISISGEKYTWWVSVYPDSVHTLNWLESHGVLCVEVCPDNIYS